MEPRALALLRAALLAPLVIPFTGAWVYFALHEWFEPAEWGLPPLHSFVGLSLNCTLAGYVFTWLYGLPLALVLRLAKRYRVGHLLAAGALPALSLPFWQTGWTIAVLPVFLAGTSTAYAFWRLAQWKAAADDPPRAAS